MDVLKHLLPLIFSGSLAALVLAVGLDATRDDLLYFLKHPKRLLFAFIAISVVVPVVAVLVVSALPLRPISKAGIVLMALAPVPPLVPGKDLKVGGRKAYVYGLYVAFAVLAVVIVPITVAILSAIYGTSVSVPVATIARVVLATVLAPLAVGMALRATLPHLAEKAAPIVSKFSLLLLGVAALPVVVAVWPAMRQATGDGTVLAIILIVAAGLLAGHVLGGPDREDRAALAMAAATRHPGIALLIANANFQDKRVSAVILLFLIVGLFAMLPYQVWVKRGSRADAVHAA